MYYPFEAQVTPLVNVRRERILPVPGDVLVKLNERVEPTQVVAHANLPGDFRVLSVAPELSVSPTKIKRYMQVKVGDNVRRGQVIAKKRNRIVKSSMAGVLASIGSGRVLVETPPTPFELRAYINGVVTNVLQNRGVVIETTGAVIQGAWGTGGESFGVLKRLVKSPDKSLRARGPLSSVVQRSMRQY